MYVVVSLSNLDPTIMKTSPSLMPENRMEDPLMLNVITEEFCASVVRHLQLESRWNGRKVRYRETVREKKIEEVMEVCRFSCAM
jgi:hypothetical protein